MSTTIDYDALKKYGFTDPASARGKIKKIRARQAIVVIGVDSLHRIFVLEAWAGRLATSRFIDKIINTCENYQTKLFGIEANSMQSLFADVVRDEARRRMKKLPLLPVQQSTRVDKDFRIRSALEPVINSGRLIIQRKQTELESELRGFPTASTKDLVDCLASAITLVPRRPVRIQRSEEAESLAAYLRQTGAPSWYIEERVARVWATEEAAS